MAENRCSLLCASSFASSSVALSVVGMMMIIKLYKGPREGKKRDRNGQLFMEIFVCQNGFIDFSARKYKSSDPAESP